jgi:TonB family protein
MSSSDSQYSSLSEFWFSIRPILLIAVLVLFSLYSNEAIIQYRMDEYNRAMETLSQTYNSSHALNMLARFELINQRRNQPEADDAAMEMRMQSLASSRLLVDGGPKKEDFQSKLIGAAIRAMGFILGKQKAAAAVPKMVQADLEAAYFFERSRKYDKAIAIYTSSLGGSGLSDDVSATLILHRGFCEGLTGDYAKAKQDYDRVASLVPGSEEAHVAARLRELTQGLEDQVRLAKSSQSTPAQAGRQMFLLANYAEAAKSLAKAIANPGTDSTSRIQSRYLYGRSQEELGQDSDAVLTYRQLMQGAPNSEEAKKANRRLYVLGKFYSNDEELAKTALKKIEQYQDFKFINSLKALEVPEAPQKRAPAVEVPANAGGPGTAGLEKLEKVDVGDLSGHKADSVAQVKKAEKAEAEKLSATFKQDVKVKKAAAKIQADPLRQEAIFSTIEGNQGELEFLYQKFMRKGTLFEGDLTVRILIDPTGAVKDARIVSEKSTIDNAAFSSDVLKTVKKWRFREDPNAKGDVPVSFPLRFVNKQ